MSGQIIATSHDLTPNGGFGKGNLLISGKSRLVKYYNLIIWPDMWILRWAIVHIDKFFLKFNQTVFKTERVGSSWPRMEDQIFWMDLPGGGVRRKLLTIWKGWVRGTIERMQILGKTEQ